MKTSIENARASRRKWYLNNKEKAIRRVKERKAEIREWLVSYRKTLQCKICGEDDIACLDFHHTNPSVKDMSIGSVAANGWGKERILKEIEKCDVLCSNCHRKLHYYS